MLLEGVNLRDPGIEILLDFGGFGAKLGLIMLKIVFDPLAATGLAQQLAIELGAPAEVQSEIAECAVVGGSMLQDRKSTRLNSVTNAQLVYRLLHEKKKQIN